MTTSSVLPKTIGVFMFFLFLTSVSLAQKNSSVDSTIYPLYHGEVSCGTCMFKMKGEGCKLAVKINEQFYFVDGAGIDDFGDAHAKDGFCNAIRKAEMKGEFKKEVFVAKKITLSKD